MSREFWLYRNHEGYRVEDKELASNHDYPVMFHVKEIDYRGEVLPNEPDYKKLAEELARAFYTVKNNGAKSKDEKWMIITEALERYRAVTEGKK